MKEELLENLRVILEKKKEALQEQAKKNARIKELEEDPKVQEYIELRHIYRACLPNTKFNDSLYTRLYEIVKPRYMLDTNGMYILNDTGRYLSGFKLREYRYYIDIESLDYALVLEKDFERFESDNVILTGVSVSEAQCEFLKLAVEKGQEVAVDEMEKRYGSKKRSK